MSLVILNPDSVPAGGWVYTDPQTQFVIKHNNLQSLYKLAERHRQANNLELKNEEFLAVICQNTGGAQCQGESPSLIVRAGNFSKEMGRWAASGFSLANEEVLAKRRDKCESCPNWQGHRGGSLMSGRCKLCGCAGIKLALATSKCPAGLW